MPLMCLCSLSSSSACLLEFVWLRFYFSGDIWSSSTSHRISVLDLSLTVYMYLYFFHYITLSYSAHRTSIASMSVWAKSGSDLHQNRLTCLWWSHGMARCSPPKCHHTICGPDERICCWPDLCCDVFCHLGYDSGSYRLILLNLNPISSCNIHDFGEKWEKLASANFLNDRAACIHAESRDEGTHNRLSTSASRFQLWVTAVRMDFCKWLNSFLKVTAALSVNTFRSKVTAPSNCKPTLRQTDQVTRNSLNGKIIKHQCS